MEKYWFVLAPEGENYRGVRSHVVFGTVQELISYATSKNELIKITFLSEYYYAYVLGGDGKNHPEILEIIVRKLCEIRQRMENSPFKKLEGLFK